MSDPHIAPQPPSRQSRWQPDRDLVLSVAAVVISLCALGASIMQATVMRAQQYASVWPRLTTALNVNVDPDSLTLSVRNAGVGPAQIEWAQATFNGAVVDGWPTLASQAARATTVPASARASLIYNSLTGGVLIPGEREVAFQLVGDPARQVSDVAGRIGLRICYCSVFDRCWQLENRSIGARVPQERVVPVSACERPTTAVL